jgi:hypothetical protein
MLPPLAMDRAMVVIGIRESPDNRFIGFQHRVCVIQ